MYIQCFTYFFGFTICRDISIFSLLSDKFQSYFLVYVVDRREKGMKMFI